MITEYNRLRALIQELETSLRSAPEGTFYTTRNGNYTKWYLYSGGRNFPVSKKDPENARALAAATFDRIRLKEAFVELGAIKSYLRNVSQDAATMSPEKYLAKYPEVRKLLKINPAWSEMVRKWASEPYTRSTREFKGTLYPTLKGDLVKSKAERDIADALFLAGIPYRYECAVSFDNGRTTFYPDFLIMHPLTGELYIWEHFGMEELGYYRRKNANKMYEYFDNSFVPGKNLICTCYSGEKELTKAQIQKTIDFYYK